MIFVTMINRNNTASVDSGIFDTIGFEGSTLQIIGSDDVEKSMEV